MLDRPWILGWGQAKFVEPFCQGAGGRMATHEELLSNTTLPMAASGITKNIVPDLARQRGLDWYYIDTGYFGNPIDYKKWFRVTRSGHQHTGPIESRPADRLKKMKLDRTWFDRGRQICLVPPDAKVCYHYRLPDPEQWITDTVELIKRYTDRRIVIRQRPASRHDRTHTDRFVDALTKDIWATVVYSSNCAVESLQHGIPVIALGESAARPLSGKIQDIDSIAALDPADVDAWLRHLSYCQFTKEEMMSGYAWQTVSR